MYPRDRLCAAIGNLRQRCRELCLVAVVCLLATIAIALWIAWPQSNANLPANQETLLAAIRQVLSVVPLFVNTLPLRQLWDTRCKMQDLQSLKRHFQNWDNWSEEYRNEFLDDIRKALE